MMNDINCADEKLKIDPVKLQRMQARVLLIERNNILTNALTDNQMIENIKKIIIEEAKKCY